LKTGSSTITSTTAFDFTNPTSNPAASQTTTQTILMVYDPNRKIKNKTGTQAVQDPQATQDPQPVQEINNSPDAVFKNMCQGIKEMAGAVSNTIELTKATDAQYRANRKAMCPKGWCANGVKQYIADNYGNGVPSWAEEAITAAGGMQCDEFPFARTVEGGNLTKGVRKCIPAADNNWQGGTLSKYFKKMFGSNPNPEFIDVGEKFVVALAGWDCATNMPKLNDLLELLNSTLTTSKSAQMFYKRDVFSTGIAIDGGKRTICKTSENATNII
jgi:hypothetical protein